MLSVITVDDFYAQNFKVEGAIVGELSLFGVDSIVLMVSLMQLPSARIWSGSESLNMKQWSSVRKKMDFFTSA